MNHSLLALMLGVVAWSPAVADVVTMTPTPMTYVAKRGTTNIATNLPDVASCWSKVYADVEARKTGSNYSCVGTSKATVSYKAPAPCGPAPASLTQNAQCPSGTTGTFAQVKTWSSVAAPECWRVAPEWSPTTPPVGSCPVAPAQTWTFLGYEYDDVQLTVPANSTVRYGYGSTWVQKTVSGAFYCDNATFTDPFPGQRKQCELLQVPQVTGSAKLSWTAPTTNADGTPLTDLAGYRVLWGTSPGNYTNSAQVNGLGATLDNLAPGTYYFVVRAVDTSANESADSAVVSKTVK